MPESQAHTLLPKRVLLAAACALLVACAGPADCPVAESAESRQLHVVRHRWHTGVILPADRLPAGLSFLKDDLPGADYYEFGWGDAAFYRERGAGSGLAARALLWPTDSVMHVVAIRGNPAHMPHTDLQAIPVSERSLAQLGQSLTEWFERGEQGRADPLGPGLYGDSRFYPARGRFWLGSNCNTWTAAMLQAAGLTGGGPPRLTAGSVLRLSERIGKACGGRR